MRFLLFVMLCLLAGCASNDATFPLPNGSQRNDNFDANHKININNLESHAFSKMSHAEKYIYKQLTSDWKNELFRDWLEVILISRGFAPNESDIPFCNVASHTISLNNYVLLYYKKSKQYSHLSDFSTIDPRWYWELRSKCKSENTSSVKISIADKKIPNNVGHFFKFD